VLPAAPLAGQAIGGTVIDGVTTRPITNAEIRVFSSDRVVASAVTDSAGAFFVRVSSRGEYRVSARALGFAARDSLPVTVEPYGLVEVTIRLSAAPVALDAITVEARRRDPRHAATYDGFYYRRENLPPIGNRRAVSREDPEMVNASRLEHVLDWFPGIFCRVGYVNGVYHSPMSFGIRVEATPVVDIDGVEFYRYGDEAPLEMRGPHHCAFAMKYSVLAIWLRRPGR
jgi:hypothetical protein